MERSSSLTRSPPRGGGGGAGASGGGGGARPAAAAPALPPCPPLTLMPLSLPASTMTAPASFASPGPRRPPLPASGSPRASHGTTWGGAPSPRAASTARSLRSLGGRSLAGSLAGAPSGGGGAAAAAQAVCVVLQIRPMSGPEVAEGCEQLIRVSDDARELVIESGAGRSESYGFDSVYGESAGGAHSGGIYPEIVAPLVEGVFGGVSATAMVYGVTGAGKSYTMGTDLERCQQAISRPQDAAAAAAAAAPRAEPASAAPPPAFPSCLGAAEDGLPELEPSASPRLSQSGSEADCRTGSPRQQEWRPLVHEVIDDACARAGALAAQGVDVQMFCSFIEIHQDNIHDLLAPSARRARAAAARASGGGGGAAGPAASAPRSLTYRDPDPTKDIILVGLEEVTVSNRQQLLQCLLDGLRARRTAATNANAHSSRSHAVFTLRVRQTARRGGAAAGGDAGGALARQLSIGAGLPSPGGASLGGGASDCVFETLEAKLHLVDLAGSERIGRTGVRGAQRLLEACSINQGLLALGNVIDALAERRKHIPYRDHVLTRMLRNALGGNNRTVMVACVSPADLHLAETLSTLRYATRARAITNTPMVNSARKKAELGALRTENETLLQDQIDQITISPPSEAGAEAAADLAEALSSARAELEAERAAGALQEARLTQLATQLREAALERIQMAEAMDALRAQLVAARVAAVEAGAAAEEAGARGARAEAAAEEAEARAERAERVAAAAARAAEAAGPARPPVAAPPPAGALVRAGRRSSAPAPIAPADAAAAEAVSGKLAEKEDPRITAAAEGSDAVNDWRIKTHSQSGDEGFAAAIAEAAAAAAAAEAEAEAAPTEAPGTPEAEAAGGQGGEADAGSGLSVQLPGHEEDQGRRAEGEQGQQGEASPCKPSYAAALLCPPAKMPRTSSHAAGPRASHGGRRRSGVACSSGGAAGSPRASAGGARAAGAAGAAQRSSAGGAPAKPAVAHVQAVQPGADAPKATADDEWQLPRSSRRRGKHHRSQSAALSAGGAEAAAGGSAPEPHSPRDGRGSPRPRGGGGGRMGLLRDLIGPPMSEATPRAPEDSEAGDARWHSALVRGTAADAVVCALEAADGDTGDWGARRQRLVMAHGQERRKRRREEADEARAALEGTDGSIAAAAAGIGGAGYSAAAVAEAARRVGEACGGEGRGDAAGRYLEWAVRVASQQAELEVMIEAERAERRSLREQLDAALAAAEAAGADNTAAPAPGAVDAAEVDRLQRRASDLRARLDAHSKRMQGLLSWQRELDGVALEASAADGAAAAGEAIWRGALSLGVEPWRAFASLLVAAGALRGRAEAQRLRADDAEADAALQRRLAALASDEAGDLRLRLAGAQASMAALGEYQSRCEDALLVLAGTCEGAGGGQWRRASDDESLGSCLTAQSSWSAAALDECLDARAASASPPPSPRRHAGGSASGSGSAAKARRAAAAAPAAAPAGGWLGWLVRPSLFAAASGRHSGSGGGGGRYGARGAAPRALTHAPALRAP
ncbi:kinesin [Raphidocelis subcapitata]|uniref:Kinesin n=1 Tax=Raphidocelis subcapitata TaxID=307507 RepID=A0A2V0NV99_9CHLO|nr:kinesin [Raphidocelis subcapitata]|eukprot:GBF91568.1 kinesin [Raphidocelis subcapitata]